MKISRSQKYLAITVLVNAFLILLPILAPALSEKMSDATMPTQSVITLVNLLEKWPSNFNVLIYFELFILFLSTLWIPLVSNAALLIFAIARLRPFDVYVRIGFWIVIISLLWFILNSLTLGIGLQPQKISRESIIESDANWILIAEELYFKKFGSYTTSFEELAKGTATDVQRAVSRPWLYQLKTLKPGKNLGGLEIEAVLRGGVVLRCRHKEGGGVNCVRPTNL